MRAAGRKSGRPTRPKPQVAEVAWLLSKVQLAVVQGRYIEPPRNNALHHLMRLKQVDPTGKRLAEAQTSMASTLQKRADEFWRKGATDAARPLYRLVLLLDPDDAQAKRRIRVPDAGPKQASATRTAPRRASTDPGRSRQLVLVGQEMVRQGKLSDAQTRFQEAVEANPRNTGAYTGLATVAFERAKYDQTVTLARRVVRMNPRAVKGHILLGDAYFKLLRRNEALKAWQQVLKLDPKNRIASNRIERLKHSSM
jgi:tetratricopeptide (TPR) repeat protein